MGRLAGAMGRLSGGERGAGAGDGGDLAGGGTIAGNLVITGTLNVQGAADLDSTLNVDGASTIRKLYGAPASQNLSLVSDTVLPAALNVYLTNTSGGSLTLTSTPSISTTGVADGQIVVLHNFASNTIVIQDVASLAGSKCRFAAGASKSITPHDTMAMVYVAASDEWRQLTTLQGIV